MPETLHSKCVILPNFPEYFHCSSVKETSQELRIIYNGWMGLNRGTEIAEGLLKTKLPVRLQGFVYGSQQSKGKFSI